MNKILRASGNIFHMVFILPSIIFWAMYIYAGHSLLGFFSLSAFFLEKYQKADEAAKIVFVNGLSCFIAGFVLVLGIIRLLLNLGQEKDNAKS